MSPSALLGSSWNFVLSFHSQPREREREKVINQSRRERKRVLLLMFACALVGVNCTRSLYVSFCSQAENVLVYQWVCLTLPSIDGVRSPCSTSIDLFFSISFSLNFSFSSFSSKVASQNTCKCSLALKANTPIVATSDSSIREWMLNEMLVCLRASTWNKSAPIWLQFVWTQ